MVKVVHVTMTDKQIEEFRGVASANVSEGVLSVTFTGSEDHILIPLHAFTFATMTDEDD